MVTVMMYKTGGNVTSCVSYVPSLLPLLLALSGASVPLEKRMESSCRRGGGLRSGEQQDGVKARILDADTE